MKRSCHQWRVLKSIYGAVAFGCCWSTNHKFYSGGRWTWPTPLQCWLGGRQVHLGFASVYLPPSSSTLRWSCTRRKASTPRLRLGVLAFLLVELQLKYASSKFKSNSASPRWTWTWTRRTWEESVVGTSCNFSSSPPRQVQVQLGFASLNLDLTRGTWAESAKFTSPRCRTYTKVFVLKKRVNSTCDIFTTKVHIFLCKFIVLLCSSKFNNMFFDCSRLLKHCHMI